MFGKYRRLHEGLFWQNFGVYYSGADPANPPATDPKDKDPADPADKDPKEGEDDKDPKEGELAIKWRVDDKGRKFFTGPDGAKYFSGQDLQRVVADRLNEDRTKQKIEADRIAAEKNGEFQKLYDAEKAKVEPLTQKAEKFDRLSVQFHKTIDAQIKDWPAELKAAVPGPEADVEARAAMVETLTPAASKWKAGGSINGEHGDQGGKDVKDIVTTYTDRTYKRPSERAKEKAKS